MNIKSDGRNITIIREHTYLESQRFLSHIVKKIKVILSSSLLLTNLVQFKKKKLRTVNINKQKN